MLQTEPATTAATRGKSAEFCHSSLVHLPVAAPSAYCCSFAGALSGLRFWIALDYDREEPAIADKGEP